MNAPEPDVLAFLSSADLTAGLEHDARAALAAALQPTELPSGGYLMRQGEAGDAMYFVVHGRLGVIIDSDTGPKMVGRISPGAVVGELALIGDTTRLASVVALRDTQLLELSNAAFERITDEHPALLRSVSKTVVHRLAERSTAGVAPSRTVAVLDVGDTPSPLLGQFWAALAEGLTRYGSVGSVEVGSEFEVAAASAQLHAAEDAHPFVILRGIPHVRSTEWAVRSADVVLLVATASHQPGLSPALQPVVAAAGERLLAPETIMVVLHEARTTPSDSSAWLDAVATDRIFHLRLDAGDGARVARHLAGRSVGVALGGGGARGFAHLGVLRALDEAGIPIDAIGGTSIGALVAGLYAMGWDADEREERALEALTRSGPLFGATLPVLSLSSAGRLQALLTDERYFGERQIEDLWVPYCCVSSDLTTATTVVHRRGPLALSVRASASLPGVLPPVAAEGSWLVDGGVLDNVPVSAVRERNSNGPTIAVDIRPKIDHLSLTPDVGSSMSGWSLVGRRTKGPEQRVPSLIDVLLRATSLGSTKALRDTLAQQPVDLLVEPPVAGHRVLDFRRGPALIRTAYEHTIAALEDAPRRLWP